MAEGAGEGWVLKTLVPVAISCATLAFGIYQYADKQEQANKEPFLREQLKLVFEASEVVAVLSTTTDPAVFSAKRDRFWTLYWGPLSIVEDRAVENWMADAGRLMPAPADPVPALPLAGLQSTSLELAHAARELVLTSWNVDLEPLRPAPEQ